MFKSLQDKKPIKILFICSGNIMRSPMAEMLFEKLFTEKYGEKWRERITVASGGVRFKNSQIFPGTREVLLSEGIPEQRIAKFKPRHIENHPDLFAEADVIIAMTEGQVKRLLNYEPRYSSKTTLLKKFVSDGRPIPDPWFSLRRKKALQEVKETILDGLEGLMKEIEGNRIIQ
ncbi:MAG: low molecular weight phosphatase family protein [Candidatus Hodarchaeota archaeon]